MGETSMAAVTVGFLPKSTENPYFEDCRLGALEAAQDNTFEVRWEGPAQPSAEAQADIVRGFVRDRLDVIAVSVEDAQTLSGGLREARSSGIKVLTWDADSESDARDFTVVAATADAIAQALGFETGRILGGKGSLAVITSSSTAPNQAEWLSQFRSRIAADYPKIEIAAVRECQDVEENARKQVEEVIQAFPDLRAVVGLCSPAVPGAAAALASRTGPRIGVTGVSLPSLCKPFLEKGLVDSVVAWSARKLGYLAAVSAHALATGGLKPGATMLRAGKLGSVFVRDDEIRLGRVHIVNARNLAQFLA
jgi:ABC-type sugar transport system substrate-binding protein